MELNSTRNNQIKFYLFAHPNP